MRKRLILAIRNSWFSPVFEHISGEDFFKRILTIYNMLEAFEIANNDTVALYGRNSMNWIAIYIACLLKGVRLLVIHPDIDVLEVPHVSYLTNFNHLFIDDELISKEIGKGLFIQTLIDIETLEVVFERSDKSNFKAYAKVLVSAEESNVIDIKILDHMLNEKESKSSVITSTMGTDSDRPKWVESSTTSIESLVLKAFLMVPFDHLDKVYANIEFAESHYLTVLLPFIKRCTFVTNLNEAEVVIEDTISIESIWRQNVNHLHGKMFLSFLFTLSWTKGIFKWLARLIMGRYYGKRLKSLIIYNSVISDEILLTLISKLPIYTTYGSQETNQLVAINDFSKKTELLPNAVGRPLPGILFNTFDDELEISSPTLFDNYVGDEAYTREVRFRDNYISGDIGSYESNTNVLFIHGRKSAIYYDDTKFPVQLDKLEKIIKSIPYIQEVILYPQYISTDGTNEGLNRLILLVYPDTNFIETKKVGYLKLKEIMKVYLHKINDELNGIVKIDKVITITTPMKKALDGKICRYFYS